MTIEQARSLLKEASQALLEGRAQEKDAVQALEQANRKLKKDRKAVGAEGQDIQEFCRNFKEKREEVHFRYLDALAASHDAFSKTDRLVADMQAKYNKEPLDMWHDYVHALHEYERGAEGFYEYMSKQGNPKTSANNQAALEIIQAAATPEHERPVHNGLWWLTETKTEGFMKEAFSLESMKEALEMLPELLSWRKVPYDGLHSTTMLVSSRLMAIAQTMALSMSNGQKVGKSDGQAAANLLKDADLNQHPADVWYRQGRRNYNKGDRDPRRVGNWQNLNNPLFLSCGFALAKKGIKEQTPTDCRQYAQTMYYQDLGSVPYRVYMEQFNTYYNQIKDRLRFTRWMLWVNNMEGVPYEPLPEEEAFWEGVDPEALGKCEAEDRHWSEKARGVERLEKDLADVEQAKAQVEAASAKVEELCQNYYDCEQLYKDVQARAVETEKQAAQSVNASKQPVLYGIYLGDNTNAVSYILGDDQKEA